jgi:rod shape-determining protein MreD
MLELLRQYPPQLLSLLNGSVTIGSVAVCALAMLFRAPIMELTGIGPHWLLIWVVVWSVNRNALQGVIVGLILGWIQDGLTSLNPSHAIPLAVVGLLTALIQKQKFIVEDFISVALIVFGMVIVADTIMALQLSWHHQRSFSEIWDYYRQATLSSAVLSSLWAPVVYYPLNRWWHLLAELQET